MQRRQGCEAILMEFLGSHVQVRKRLNRGALRDLAGPMDPWLCTIYLQFGSIHP